MGQNVVADISHAHGNLVGDFRFGYNRYDMKEFPMGSQAAIGSALGIANAPDQFLPGFNIGGTLNLGSLATSPQRGVDNSFNFNTSWNLHTSMHNIKFGVDVQHYRTDGFNNLFFGPSGNGGVRARRDALGQHEPGAVLRTRISSPIPSRHF